MVLQILGNLIDSPLSKMEIARKLHKSKPSRYLNDPMAKLLKSGKVAYTIPDKPTSRLQKYRLTEKGRALLSKSKPS